MPIKPKNIPIFIIMRDRLDSLILQLESFESRGYENIYIIDNKSSYPPVLDFYANTKHKIIRMEKNYGHMVFHTTDLFKQYGNDYYAITDCDVIPVEECPDNFMEIFLESLHAYPAISKAGFGLKIDDLPDHYPLKQQVISWEKQFWTLPLQKGLYSALIDSTFALYRPNRVYSRYPDTGIRSDFPYLARHTGWYIDVNNLPDDEKHYIDHLETSTGWTIKHKEIINANINTAAN